jgi:hypothetical protein
VLAVNPLDDYVYLLRFDGQRRAAFSMHFQAGGDGSLAGVSLADATGDGRAFGALDPVLIAFKSGHELHTEKVIQTIVV